jgi:hypothetical protein
MTQADRVGGLAMEALRAAGEPVREAVLYERVLARGADLPPEAFIAVMERLATERHVRMSVEHDLPARDPAPFGPRFWTVVR